MNIEQIRRFTAQIRNIAKKHGVSKIYVFGSAARGQSSGGSDVDFLVEMEGDASLFGAAGFGYEVEQLLGVQVDVVPISALPLVKDRRFAENVQKDAITL